jgi:hypothetical protein
MSVTREPCGCRHNARAWLELCPAHKQEAAERHEAHAAEMAARRDRDMSQQLPAAPASR